MRRALFALVAVLLLSAAGFIGVPFVRARALAEQLAKDVAAQRARELQRTSPVREPIHDNGFQCLGGMLKVTPRDLSPFGVPENLVVAPEVFARQVAALTPWADNLRACGESRWLRFAPGADPMEPSTELPRAALALAHVTVAQTRADLEAGRPVDASLRCQATLAAAFDWTRLGEPGLVSAARLARQVLPACAAALNALPPPVRADAAQTWVTLLPRVVSLGEFFELERVSREANTFLPLTTESSLLRAHQLRRLWPGYDEAFRALIEAPDAAARARAAEALNAASAGQLSLTEDVAARERDVKDLTTISVALTWLAGGAAGKPPVGERTEAGLVLPLEPPVTVPLNP